MERQILVVDTDSGARATLCGVLARDGHVALEAADGETGYAMAREQVLDLVIADIYLPAGGWPCVVRAIKRDPLLRALPLLVYTARATPEDVRWAVSGGCDGLLAKPAGADEISREVGRLLELRTGASSAEGMHNPGVGAPRTSRTNPGGELSEGDERAILA